MLSAEIYLNQFKFLGEIQIQNRGETNSKGEHMYDVFIWVENEKKRVIVSHDRSENAFVLVLKALDSLKKNGHLDAKYQEAAN